MEVYFISSSVLQSSHFNFYGTILKLEKKSEKMVDYSTPPKKAERSLSGAATYKSRLNLGLLHFLKLFKLNWKYQCYWLKATFH